MREIEFRGKRIDNGEWVYGGYHKHINRTPCPIGDEINECDIAHLIIEDGFSDWNLPKPIIAHETDVKTIGQYIGLRDKNGTKIFVGDILSVPDSYDGDRYFSTCIGAVTLCEDLYYYVDCSSGDFSYDETEIIGNIHDNPELLS